MYPHTLINAALGLTDFGRFLYTKCFFRFCFEGDRWLSFVSSYLVVQTIYIDRILMVNPICLIAFYLEVNWQACVRNCPYSLLAHLDDGEF